MALMTKRRLSALTLVGLLLTGFALLAYAFGSLTSLENSSVDKRFEWRGTKSTAQTRDIVMVKIDDKSFSELNTTFPFPRGLHAQMVDDLKKDGAKLILYDVQFTEPSDDPDQDDDLIYAVQDAGNVVLVTSETYVKKGKTRTKVFGGDDVVKEARATVGNSVVPNDTGNVVRSLYYEFGGLQSAPVAVARRLGRTVERSEFNENGRALVNFAGPPSTIPSVSFSSVIDGKVDPKFFKDKIVIVGAFAVTLQDFHRTPTSGESRMPGPELLANSIGTILDDFPLRNAPAWLDVLLIILLGMTTPLASLKFNPRGAFIAALTTAFFFTVFTYMAFNNGLIWVYVYPMLALTLTTIAALGVNYLAASYDRQLVRGEFARFAPDSVVDQILENADGEATRLGGKRLTATLLFSDLRGFTSFSEKMTPEQVIAILNDYLTEMSDAIMDHGGTLVSYMGDGIMAVFGAPIASEDHADRGLAAAREMLERLGHFNARLARDHGIDKHFKMGIGLNTGPVMSGNVGSERRMEYTAIGDTTNTAARLEALTKGSGYQLFLSESTKMALHEVHDDIKFVRTMEVRGREQGVNVWGLDEPHSDDEGEHFESVSQSPMETVVAVETAPEAIETPTD